MANYDPRTGRKLGAGTTQDFSNYKGTFKFDAKTGKALTPTRTPTTNIPSAIKPSQLEPVQPFNLPKNVPPVPNSGLSSAITGSVEATKNESQRLRAEREQAQEVKKSGLTQSIEDIMKLNEDVANVGNTVDRTAEDTARIEADKYTSQIEAEQLAVRRAVENLQKNNPQGLFGGALTDEVNRLERNSLSKQADLAILQNSALRNYTTAKDIADREVQNKLEPLKVKLENLKFFYQENKELFNKEDDRLYNEKIKEQERELDKQENLENNIMSIKLEAAKNGAPASILNKLSTAKTFDEALRFAGNYSMSVDDRLKQYELGEAMAGGKTGALTPKDRTKLLADPTAKATTAMISVNNILNDYRNMVAGFGKAPSVSERKKANSYLTNILGPSLAVAQGQGALQKDEADRLIESLGVKGLWKREKITLGNVDSAIQGFKTKIDTNFGFIDSSIPGATDNFDIFKTYKINQLPPAERVKAQKVEAVQAFRESDLTDEEIVDYFVETDPANAATIQALFEEGYELEEIINSL